jgi:hypothetical protein
MIILLQFSCHCGRNGVEMFVSEVWTGFQLRKPAEAQ